MVLLHINGLGSIGPLFPLFIRVVVVFLFPPSPFPCLCSILHNFVVSCTEINVPPLGYPYLFLNVSTFSQAFSFSNNSNLTTWMQ